MSRNDRPSLVRYSGQDANGGRPPVLTMEELGHRIYSAMIAKGWSQSELAHRAGIHRESVSGYIRGKHWPKPAVVEKLASVLGTSPTSLVPNHLQLVKMQADASFEMRSIDGEPGRMQVVLNRNMSMSAAARIAAIVDEDAASGE